MEARRSWGRPTGRDAVAGLVTGLFNLPQGMAYANLGGFPPVTGLYSGMAPTIVSALTSRAVLMVTTVTSAIAISSGSVLDEAGLSATDPGAVAMLAVLVGAVMLVFGLLRLGTVMRFVSMAVMTGFTVGIALQILVGVLPDATAYTPEATTTLGKLVGVFAHPGEWDWESVAVAAGTVLVWLVCDRVGPIRRYAVVAAFGVGWLVVALAHLDVATTAELGEVPSALPPLVAPDLSTASALWSGAIAVALVGLVQGAGITATVHNPDRSRPNASRDFVAQGLANLAAGAFSSTPVGGAMSQTRVSVESGARTRWAAVFAGGWLLLLVLLIGPVADTIPLPVIGGLLFVIAGELAMSRRRDIVLELRTSAVSSSAMGVTFVATTLLPLQQAVFIGAVLSLLLYAVSAARHGRLQAMKRHATGWELVDPPPELPSHEVTVLHYAGAGFFAEVAHIEELWPHASQCRGAAVVLNLRALPEVPSATFVKAVEHLAGHLRRYDNVLILAGLTPEFMVVADRCGLLDAVGRTHVVPEGRILFSSLDEATAQAHAWVATHDTPDPPDAP